MRLGEAGPEISSHFEITRLIYRYQKMIILCSSSLKCSAASCCVCLKFSWNLKFQKSLPWNARENFMVKSILWRFLKKSAFSTILKHSLKSTLPCQLWSETPKTSRCASMLQWRSPWRYTGAGTEMWPPSSISGSAWWLASWAQKLSATSLSTSTGTTSQSRSVTTKLLSLVYSGKRHIRPNRKVLRQWYLVWGGWNQGVIEYQKQAENLRVISTWVWAYTVPYPGRF